MAIRVLVVWLILVSPAAGAGLGAGGRGAFRDSTDGRFDLSEWLLRRKKFLLVPIIVTEPAVGY